MVGTHLTVVQAVEIVREQVLPQVTGKLWAVQDTKLRTGKNGQWDLS